MTIAAAIVGAHLAEAQTRTPPRYEADINWPKPLPNRWVLGGLGGLCVDAQGHVFILNRQDVLDGELNTGRLAPPIIEFDSEGNVVNSWGDPKLLDPRLHSCHVDKDNNIWIASAPSGMVQKYTHDGSKLLLQIGKKGVVDSSDGTVKGKPLNSNAAIFFMPSSIYVDRQNGDVYVSDGEGAGGNRRIAVMDSSGKFLRQWQPDGMETVHCMTIGNDGLVYVCNRNGSRIQVYDKMGILKRTIQVPWTPVTPPSDGAVTTIRRLHGGDRLLARSEPDLRHQPEQRPDRNHRPREREDRRQLRPLRKLPWPVQPAARDRGGLEGQRLHRREPRQAGTQVQGRSPVARDLGSRTSS